MGVKGFYRWIAQRYPLIVLPMGSASRPQINNAFIDLNGIFYSAAEVSNNKETKITEAYLSAIFKYIDFLVKLMNPSDMIYLAVDGCAPAAKYPTQRQRRFIFASMAEKNTFDCNVITPGTSIMASIDYALRQFIDKKKASSDPIWSSVKIIYSGVSVPGEGEHKVFDYIRQQRSVATYNPNQVNCVVSNDADVIVLALQSHEPYTLILKTEGKEHFPTDINSYSVLHLSLLREYLGMEFHESGEALEKTIDDFVGLSFLLGNDFVSSFPDFDIRRGAMTNLLNAYKGVKARGENLVEGCHFKRQVLKSVFQSLRPDSTGFSLHSKFPSLSDNEIQDLNRRMCKSVLSGLDWTLQYYKTDCPSWTWLYNFNYTPSISSMNEFFSNDADNFDVGAPNPPLLMELFVLPPQSIGIIPQCLRKLMVPPNPTAAFYPLSFARDQNGRKYEDEAVALLPPFDLPVITAQYQTLIQSLTPAEATRNKIGSVILYHGSDAPIALHEIAGTIFNPILMATEKPPCVPTIYGALCQEIFVPVKIFDYPSRDKSLVLSYSTQPLIENVEDVGVIMGTLVLAGWPHMVPAKVVGAISSTRKISNFKEAYDGPTLPGEVPKMRKMAEFFYKTMGVRINEPPFLIIALPVVPVGSEFKCSDEPFFYPPCFVFRYDYSDAMKRFSHFHFS